MSAFQVIVTTLGEHWRKLLLFLGATFVVAFIIGAAANAAPTLSFGDAGDHAKIAARDWCHTHNRKTWKGEFVGFMSYEACKAHGVVEHSCDRFRFERNHRQIANPRRIHCRIWIRWAHYPNVKPFDPSKNWGRWYCNDEVIVRRSTHKPYPILFRREKHPWCVHFSLGGLSARRMPEPK